MEKLTIKELFGGKDIKMKWIFTGSKYGKSYVGCNKNYTIRDETFDEYMEEELKGLWEVKPNRLASCINDLDK